MTDLPAAAQQMRICPTPSQTACAQHAIEVKPASQLATTCNQGLSSKASTLSLPVTPMSSSAQFAALSAAIFAIKRGVVQPKCKLLLHFTMA